MDGVAFWCSWCGVVSLVVIVYRVLGLRFLVVCSSVVFFVLVVSLFCVPDTCVSAAGSG